MVKGDRDSLLHLIRDHAAPRLNLLNKLTSLLDLLEDELDRDVQDVALGSALALEAGDEGGYLVEAVTDCLAALLLCLLRLASFISSSLSG